MYGPRAHSVGVWCGLGGLWVFVGSIVKVWSLIWPRDSRCRGLLWFREFTGACGLWVEGCGLSYGPRTHVVSVGCGLQGLWALVGSAVEVWFFK